MRSREVLPNQTGTCLSVEYSRYDLGFVLSSRDRGHHFVTPKNKQLGLLELGNFVS